MSILETARVRLAAIDAEIAHLRDEQTRLRSFIETGEALERSGSAAATSASNAPVAPPQATVSGASVPADVQAAARQIISAAGRPVPRAEMMKQLAARELKVAGVDPRRNLSTILWRAEDIQNLPGLGYWLPELGEWKG